LKGLDKAGSFGALLAASVCTSCFPLLAAAGSAAGLGIFSEYEGISLLILQIFVLLALAGNILAYLNHGKIIPLIFGISGPLLIFVSFYLLFSQFMIYTGLAGLLIAAVLNYVENRKCAKCAITVNGEKP